MITALLPAHNAAAYLPEALRSILAQTRPPDEIIVVDDGSTDDTGAAAEGFGPPVRCMRQPQQGAAAARNHGARLAAGEWLAFLDADDVWLPDKLAQQLAAAQADPALEAVFGWMENFISPDLDEAARRQLAPPAGPLTGIHASAMLIRRAAFARVGEFDARLQVPDFVEWWLRAQEAGLRYAVIPQVVARRRLHQRNLTRTAPDPKGQYLPVLRAALRRRRAAGE